MAFTSTTQQNNLVLGNKKMVIFRGTAGASGNTIEVNFPVAFIIGYPNATFTQSGTTVTVSGITDTHVVNLILTS